MTATVGCIYWEFDLDDSLKYVVFCSVFQRTTDALVMQIYCLKWLYFSNCTSLQERGRWEREGKREVYYEELAYTSMEAGNSQTWNW